MGYRRTKDVCVVVGEYQNAQGETKKRFENVGVVLTGDDGNSFILLDRWFNPAGVPQSGRGDPAKVALALFEPTEPGQQRRATTATQPLAAVPGTPVSTTARGGSSGLDDDIPF